MHDISEDVLEESSENEDEEDEPEESAPSSPRREIIQGLRISTGPAPPGLVATESNQVPTSMRAFSMSSVPQQQQSAQVPGGEVPSPPMRRGSMGSLSMPRRWSYAASSASSEAYDVVSERGPGNPLFPTNFARLALGPTLTAKYVSVELYTMAMAASHLFFAAIPLYVRASTLPRRRFLTRTPSAWASCAGGAASRVGRTVGIR